MEAEIYRICLQIIFFLKSLFIEDTRHKNTVHHYLTNYNAGLKALSVIATFLTALLHVYLFFLLCLHVQDYTRIDRCIHNEVST